MRNQKQPKDSNWYNNRLVLILMFLALFVIVPGMLLLLGNRQWSHPFFVHDRVYDWIIVIYLALALFVTWNLGRLISKNEKEKVRLNLLGTILNGRIDTDGLDVEISGYSYWISRLFRKRYWNNLGSAFRGKSNIHHEMIRAIENAIKNSNTQYLYHIIDDKAKETLQTLTQKSIVECVSNATVTNADDGKSSEVSFKEALKEKANKALNASNIQDALSNALSNDKVQASIFQAMQQILPKNVDISGEMIERVLKDINLERVKSWYELEGQKYRLAEHVVAEICKSSKPVAADIAEIRNMINGIIGFNSSKCSLQMLEDGSNAIIIFSDDNNKQLMLRYDNTNHAIKAVDCCGTYDFCNEFQVTIENNEIKEIKKKQVEGSNIKTADKPEEESGRSAMDMDATDVSDQICDENAGTPI